MSLTNFEVCSPVKKLMISLNGTITDPSVRFSNMNITSEINISRYQPVYVGFIRKIVYFEAPKIVQKKINAFDFIFVILRLPFIFKLKNTRNEKENCSR